MQCPIDFIHILFHVEPGTYRAVESVMIRYYTVLTLCWLADRLDALTASVERMIERIR